MTDPRREMAAVTAAALAAPLVPPGAAGAAEAARAAGLAPKFFTPPEFALLDELAELIIPADAHSPGARAAGVASYIDFRLSESLEPERQASWRSGLQAVDALSRELHGRSFLDATPDQRVAVLTRIAAAEHEPKTPAEHFFPELKHWTARTYYTSKRRIHADQPHKGTVHQRGEYAGYYSQ